MVECATGVANKSITSSVIVLMTQRGAKIMLGHVAAHKLAT